MSNAERIDAERARERVEYEENGYTNAKALRGAVEAWEKAEAPVGAR